MGPSSLTIVVANSFCHAQGGASRVAIDEAVDLANCGFDVIFFGAAGPICTELSSAPLRVICLEQPELAKSGGRLDGVLRNLWNIPAYRQMQETLKTLDPMTTIVHVHGFSQALSTSPTRCAVDMGFKVVYTLHDFFSACPNGGFFDFQTSTPCLRRALSFDCIKTNCDKRHYTHKLFRVARSAVQLGFGGLPRRVKDYITLSRRSEAVLRPYLPVDARIHPLENPIGVDQASPVDVARQVEWVVVGRLDEEKGIRVLLQAAHMAGVRLTLIGDGPLRAMAEASGLCRITGWLARDAVMEKLDSARCLIFPSLWYETYGLVVGEAAARGIPAIVSDLSAAAERVEDNVTGWHARTGDARDLARCLDLTRDDSVVRSAGTAAYRRTWADPPTRDRHVRHLIDIYRNILNAVPLKAAARPP